MKYRVIESHLNDNLNPLVIKKGTQVKVGESSDINGKWPNWIYCFSLDDKGEGWTPIQIIEVENEFGYVLEDYSAVELECSADELVNGGLELNGWVWCTKQNECESGWLPKEKLSSIPDSNV
jgi:hypothetical protein